MSKSIMVTKQQMLKKLQETEFPKNTGRQNILKKNQEFSRSMALGMGSVATWWIWLLSADFAIPSNSTPFIL